MEACSLQQVQIYIHETFILAEWLCLHQEDEPCDHLSPLNITTSSNFEQFGLYIECSPSVFEVRMCLIHCSSGLGMKHGSSWLTLPSPDSCLSGSTPDQALTTSTPCRYLIWRCNTRECSPPTSEWLGKGTEADGGIASTRSPLEGPQRFESLQQRTCHEQPTPSTTCKQC